MTAVYCSVPQAAERLGFEARYFREAIMPEMRDVIKHKRDYRIPIASLLKWEADHTVTPKVPSVVDNSEKCENKSKDNK